MSDSNEIRIDVKVAGRSYRLTIDSADEAKVRRAESMINEKVMDYKRIYTDKD